MQQIIKGMDIRESTLKEFQEGRIESFYMELYPSLLSYARRVLGPEHEFLAEDCVQEAIYRVYQSRRQFDTPLQMRSFLFTCIHNEIITIFRKSDRKERFLETRETIDNTLIDELANWVLSRRLQAAGVTTKLEVKFRRPVSTRDPQITLRGRITSNVRNFYTVHVTLHDSQGRLCDEGDVTYCMFDKERSRDMGFTACLTQDEVL